jgi:outer membrane protein OmpA-like peptidoglycan-associated protein
VYYEPYNYERSRWWRLAAVGGAVALVLLGAFAFWFLRSDSGSGDSASTSVSVSTPASTSPGGAATSSSTTSSPTSDPTTSSSVPTRVTAVDSTPGVTSSGDVPSTTSAEPPPDVPASSVAGVPPGPGAATLGYPTSPDGTPLPLVVIFDVETITISGQVPSEAQRERLAGLAIANSQFPEAEVVDNMVINPAVPLSVGVRVIELNSARFPEGSADILPDHALELDRVVTIMQALPNISVVVVGHADQRGDDIRNFAVSDERARAVVNYLLYLGISPTRLSSRAAGETDLLTIGDDDAALALNRRTEFIFYGLLIE